MQHMLSKLRDKRIKGEKGFTLIELLVVVVILGVLIAIAIPLYLNYRKGANDSATQSDVRNAISVLEVCNSGTGTYPATVTFGASTTTPCTGQTINSSSGTTMKYAVSGSGYVLAGTNSSGNGNYYCYNSTKGGSVAVVTPAPASLAVATC